MTGSTRLNVLGISGSLRRGSFNTAILKAAQRLAPADLTIEIFDLAPIPLYNEDLRAKGLPPAVVDLRARIAAADALLIATPEYNYSIPGVLKNAVDWASRPPDQPFEGKPLAVMGASPGRLGTARAQYHLRQAFIYLNALVLNQPEVMIAGANNLIGKDGKLSDDATGQYIAKLLDALAEWTRRLQASRAAGTH